MYRNMFPHTQFDNDATTDVWMMNELNKKMDEPTNPAQGDTVKWDGEKWVATSVIVDIDAGDIPCTPRSTISASNVDDAIQMINQQIEQRPIKGIKVNGTTYTPSSTGVVNIVIADAELEEF